MTTWRPVATPFRFIYLLLPVLSLALAAILWARLSERAASVPLDWGVFVFGVFFFLSLLLTGTSAYLAWCSLSLRYLLDNERLTIAVGGVRVYLPLQDVTGVHAPGEPVSGRAVRVRIDRGAVMLPGYQVGSSDSVQMGRVLSYATVPAGAQLFVRTQRVAYGISPQNSLRFLAELEKRRAVSSESGERARTEQVGWIRLGAVLWSDRVSRWLLAAGVVLNLLFFGYLSLRYGNLPSPLAMHWNSQAQVDRIGTPSELLRLPVYALLVWLANVVAARWAMEKERAVSLFLLAGGVAAQVVFWAGAVSIILRA